MKSVDLDSGFLYYQKIFKQLSLKEDVVVLWQIDPVSQKRSVHQSILTSASLEQNHLYFKLSADAKFDLSHGIYAFVHEGAFIFKCGIKTHSDETLVVDLPKEIKFLEMDDYQKMVKSLGGQTEDWITVRKNSYHEDFGEGYMKVKSLKERTAKDQSFLNEEMGLSLDEEDKLYADKRESPRTRAKGDKFVELQNIEEEVSARFKLFDLSRGGMAFVIEKANLFRKDQKIMVHSFNDYRLDDPMFGTVMSVRQIDGTDTYKVGIKFIAD